MKGKFKPVLEAEANFANGKKFKIYLVNARGACSVHNISNPAREDVSYAHSISKAWANVRYQARIIHKTERSS